VLGVTGVRHLGLHVGLRSDVEEKGVRRVPVLECRTRDLVVVVAEVLGVWVVALGREDVLGLDPPPDRRQRDVIGVERGAPLVVADGGRREVRL
jgi:hypothetical protein